MGSTAEQLVELLQELESRLEEHGKSHWVEWMSKSRRQIEAGDLHGARYLLQAYGGMGSFNDVYLEPRGHHARTFDQLQSSAYHLAQELIRSATRE